MIPGDGLKAIVFDWDLTLWNSWDTHLELLRQTADALQASQPEATDVAERYSMPFLKHLEWFFPGDQRRVVDTYMGFYQSIVTEMPNLYPGVAETLGCLKESGYGLAVFSDKRQTFGDAELAQTGIGGLIDYSLFLVDGRPYKPDPLGLLQVLDAPWKWPRTRRYTLATPVTTWSAPTGPGSTAEQRCGGLWTARRCWGPGRTSAGKAPSSW